MIDDQIRALTKFYFRSIAVGTSSRVAEQLSEAIDGPATRLTWEDRRSDTLTDKEKLALRQLAGWYIRHFPAGEMREYCDGLLKGGALPSPKDVLSHAVNALWNDCQEDASPYPHIPRMTEGIDDPTTFLNTWLTALSDRDACWFSAENVIPKYKGTHANRPIKTYVWLTEQKACVPEIALLACFWNISPSDMNLLMHFFYDKWDWQYSRYTETFSDADKLIRIFLRVGKNTVHDVANWKNEKGELALLAFSKCGKLNSSGTGLGVIEALIARKYTVSDLLDACDFAKKNGLADFTSGSDNLERIFYLLSCMRNKASREVSEPMQATQDMVLFGPFTMECQCKWDEMRKELDRLLSITKEVDYKKTLWCAICIASDSPCETHAMTKKIICEFCRLEDGGNMSASDHLKMLFVAMSECCGRIVSNEKSPASVTDVTSGYGDDE